jgi:hypothetical protein
MSGHRLRRCTWGGKPASESVSFPPHLLDELARVFARVALDRLLQESAAREPRQDDTSCESDCDSPLPKDNGVDDAKGGG